MSSTGSRQDEILSFDQDLRHAFTPLSQRLERGVEGIDKLIEILRQRIQLEAEFAKGIERILTTCDFASEETGTIRDALDAIKADMKNEVRMRGDFVNSLNEDVYAPLIQTKDLYNARNIKYAQDTKANIKSLRSEQSKWLKVKAKYDKATKEAQEARSALLNAKSNQSASSTSVIKLGSRVNSTMKAQQQTQEKYDQTKVEWNREQIKFDDTMTTVLQGMESNEEARLNALSDALTKWAVFVTNLTANRNYDVKSLAEMMSQINVKDDLQQFMRATLRKNPARMMENQTPRSVYRFDDKRHSSKPSLSTSSSIPSHGSNLRTQSLSLGQAKRRKSLSKSDLKKLASSFAHKKQKSIDLSKNGLNGLNGSSRVSGVGGLGSVRGGRHSRQNSGSEHAREDSLSKKSLSDIFKGRGFRSNSIGTSPGSNVGSKPHSREASYGAHEREEMMSDLSGVGGVGDDSILPEEETIIPMQSDNTLGAKPTQHAQMSSSSYSTSYDDPEIDGTLDVGMKNNNNSQRQQRQPGQPGNGKNRESPIKSNDKAKDSVSLIEVPADAKLKTSSVEREIKRRNHKIINSYNPESTKKNIRYSIKKNGNSSNNSARSSRSNSVSKLNANAMAAISAMSNRSGPTTPIDTNNNNNNNNRRRSSTHLPPTMKAPTPPDAINVGASPAQVSQVSQVVAQVPNQANPSNQSNESNQTNHQNQNIQNQTNPNQNSSNSNQSNQNQNDTANTSIESDPDSTPTLSGISMSDNEARMSNDLIVNDSVKPSINPVVTNFDPTHRTGSSPPASARTSLAHINKLRVVNQELKQSSIPENSEKNESKHYKRQKM